MITQENVTVTIASQVRDIPIFGDGGHQILSSIPNCSYFVGFMYYIF